LIAAAFPTEEWAFCKYQSDGLHVTTNSGRFSYSVQYAPFTTVKTGFYRFVLRYDHLNSGLLFGALSGDQSHWVVPPEAGRKGRSGTKTAYLSLESGEQLVLMVCNFSAYAPNHSSTFVIKSVRALPLSISSVSQFRIPKSMPLAPAVDIADAMMSSWLSRLSSLSTTRKGVSRFWWNGSAAFSNPCASSVS
jgi:hypothetical protein